MYKIFISLLIFHISTQCNPETKSARHSYTAITQDGQEKIERFIQTHENIITASKILDDIMTQYKLSNHKQLCTLIGKNPDLLRTYSA